MRPDPPDFRQLVGEEGSPQELDRLRRVHELLVAAGPPPQLSPGLARPPRVGRLAPLARPRRRSLAALALAFALAAGAFAVGYGVAPKSGFQAVRVVPMHGLGRLAQAHAVLKIGRADAHGNVPIEMEVRGLPPLPAGAYYELYLSKKGKPSASCGTFRTGPGTTSVRLTIAYQLQPWGRRWDGWVVTVHRPGRPVASELVVLAT